MALSKFQQEGLDKLDLSKGGGFVNFVTSRNRLEAQQHKFLFIGLGGKGSSVVAKLKTEAYKRFELDGENKRPKNFEYLAIDTDIPNLEKLSHPGYGEIGLSNETTDNELCQLFDADAASRLRSENRHLVPSYIREWLSPTMNQELAGLGAGGIRQAGRYLLFGESAFKRVENAIRIKLMNLHDQITNPLKESLVVYVIAGIGGGTGSGTILDIPYIVRSICQSNRWKCKVSGYIFLPDTYSHEAPSIRLKYNSYAALKEIDYFMNIGQMAGAGHFHTKYTTEFEIDMKEKIFDTCVLVSGKTANQGVVPNPDLFSQRVVVDNIINLVKKNNTTDGFMIDSFLDNSPNDIKDAINRLSETIPRCANYQYNVIGIGAVNLPMEQIMSYLSHETFVLLKQALQVHPVQSAVEDFLNRLHMSPDEMRERILNLSKKPLLQYKKGIGGKVSKADIQTDMLYNSLKGHWMNSNVALYNEWDKVRNLVLSDIVEQFTREYRKVFTGKGQGIYYAYELLGYRVENGDAFNGVLCRIRSDFCNAISNLKEGEYTFQAQQDEEMRDIKNKIESVFCIGPLFQTQVERYRKCCIEKLVSENMVSLYDRVLTNTEEVLLHVEKRTEELMNYIDVLEGLQEILDRNFRCVVTNGIPAVEYSTQLLDMSSPSQVTLRIKEFLDRLVKKKEPEGMVCLLEEKIQKSEDKWRDSRENFNPMRVFTAFIEEQYSEIPDLTIEKFIELAYGRDRFSEGMLNICERLENNSRVIFANNMSLPLESLPSKKYIVAPDKALGVVSAVEGYAKAHGVSVARSNDMNNIYWYNWICGVPLFALADIAEYEKIYEEQLSGSGAGLHIVEESDVDYWDLPSLYTSELWIKTEPDFNNREKDVLKKVKERTELFKRYGMIREEGKYHYATYLDVKNMQKTREAIKEWCEQNYLTEERGLNENGLLDEESKLYHEILKKYRYEESMIEIPNLYIDRREENLFYHLRMNWMLYRKLEKSLIIFEDCRNMVVKENKEKEKQLNERRNLERFFQYLRTGIVMINEDAVLVKKKNKEEEALLYFEDISGIQSRFYLYAAFEKMYEKYREKELEELDEWHKELMMDRKPEAKEERGKRENEYLESCRACYEDLKKADTKRVFEKSGNIKLLNKYKWFYEEMLGLKTGL